MKETVEKVLSLAKRMAFSYIELPLQRKLLDSVFQGLHQDLKNEKVIPYIQIPLLIQEGFGGHEEGAYPLAAVNTLLFCGIDILDDLADGDAPIHWKDAQISQLNLMAFTLLCALPQKIISEFDKKSLEARFLMQKALADGFMKMSMGQARDLAMVQEENISSESILDSVIHKSGEELALFATLGGHYVGIPQDEIDLLSDVGRNLGVAIQLASDCYDIFEAPVSRDLLHGAQTLPLSLHFEKLNEDDKKYFLCLLKKAKKDTSLYEFIKKELRKRGSLRHTAWMVELYCQRAHAVLNQTKLHETSKQKLKEIIHYVSFY